MSLLFSSWIKLSACSTFCCPRTCSDFTRPSASLLLRTRKIHPSRAALGDCIRLQVTRLRSVLGDRRLTPWEISYAQMPTVSLTCRHPVRLRGRAREAQRRVVGKHRDIVAGAHPHPAALAVPKRVEPVPLRRPPPVFESRYSRKFRLRCNPVTSVRSKYFGAVQIQYFGAIQISNGAFTCCTVRTMGFTPVDDPRPAKEHAVESVPYDGGSRGETGDLCPYCSTGDPRIFTS